jgi:hypothetical protein
MVWTNLAVGKLNVGWVQVYRKKPANVPEETDETAETDEAVNYASPEGADGSHWCETRY